MSTLSLFGGRLTVEPMTHRLAATRIKARAIRRCGELLKQIEGAKNQHDAKSRGARGAAPPSRSAAATAAGLSRDQKRDALRVASIPADDFERSA